MIEENMVSIKIGKLNAARRQLETAIKLFFVGDDPVSTHTLASAAYDVIKDVNKSRGGKPMFLKNRYANLPGKPTIKMINSAQNFFKHADNDSTQELDFPPIITQILLVDACRTYMDLTGENVALFHCIMWWFKSSEGESCFNWPEEKRLFLRDLLNLYRKGDRQGFLDRCILDSIQR